MARALALALLLSCVARAEVTPPQPLPAVADEPLPEWHPPPRAVAAPVFLTVAPEMTQAQRGRQAGLWISCIGWMSLLGAGILAAHAADITPFFGQPHIVGSDLRGNTIVALDYDAQLHAEQHRYDTAALSLAVIGGTMALGGFALFSVEQARIHAFHKRRPRDPLPPLPGI